MRKYNWKKRRNQMTTNQRLIIVGVVSILIITIGYSVMQNVLKIRGYASIDRGDGMIFTRVDVKENTEASLESVPSIKAKTMINTKVSFSTPGSITFTVAAQNQGEYDAKLIEIQKLEQVNNAEPTCIKTSVVNHNIGETVYTGAIATSSITSPTYSISTTGWCVT